MWRKAVCTLACCLIMFLADDCGNSGGSIKGSGIIVDAKLGSGTYARCWQDNRCPSGTCCEELKQ